MLQSTKQRKSKWPEVLLQEMCRVSSPDHGLVGVEDMHEEEAGSMPFSNHLGKTVNHKEPVVQHLQLVRHKDRSNTRQWVIINAVAAKVGDTGHTIARRLNRVMSVVVVVEGLHEEDL